MKEHLKTPRRRQHIVLYMNFTDVHKTFKLDHGEAA